MRAQRNPKVVSYNTEYIPSLARASDKLYKKCAGRAVAGHCYAAADVDVSSRHVSLCVAAPAWFRFSQTEHTDFHADFRPVWIAECVSGHFK
jgi:hypothetical protein